MRVNWGIKAYIMVGLSSHFQLYIYHGHLVKWVYPYISRPFDQVSLSLSQMLFVGVGLTS